MRISAGLIAGLFLVGAWAAEGDKPGTPADREIRTEMLRKLMELERRAYQMYPRRRDTPLRVLNMTDGEVREVETIARKYEMPVLMNISPVVTGCACEEGGSCTEQVHIVSKTGEGTTSLQLSRSKNAWDVGVVQKWWLEYAELLARERSMSRREFDEARMMRLLQFPMCQQNQKTTVAGTNPTK